MTKLIVVAIAALSITAHAQTSASSNNDVAAKEMTTTSSNQPAVTKKTNAKNLKAAAAKKSKETKASTSMATAVTAPIISSENPITSKEEKSMTPADINSAAGTSTAKVSETDAAKKWKGTLRTVTDIDENFTKSIQTITTAGVSYKASDKITLKISENFESLNASGLKAEDADKRELVDRSNFRAAYTDFAVATSLAGMMGSNDMPVSLNYKKMSGDAVITQKGAYSAADAFIELNAGLPYTLSPKVDLSIDGQIRHVLNDAKPNSTRALVIPTLSYTINQYLAVYQSAGLILSMKDNSEFRRAYERFSLATGLSVTATKNLSFDMNVSQDKAFYASPTSGVDVTGFKPYSTTSAAVADSTLDAVAYEFVAVYNF